MALGQLPSLNEQADRLVSLGITALGGLSPAQICTAVSRTDADNALLVVHPDRVSAFELAPFLKHRGKSGFVVDDMADVDQFIPIDTSAPPAPPLYLVHDINRGDEMTGWSPDEALPTITAAGRTPLTLVEGIHWLLQQPEALAHSHCFMTIGSRLRRPDGTLDPRTPALWISKEPEETAAADVTRPRWAGVGPETDIHGLVSRPPPGDPH